MTNEELQDLTIRRLKKIKSRKFLEVIDVFVKNLVADETCKKASVTKPRNVV